MNDKIVFSVVIPTYNASAFIEKALVSVCEQSYPHFEIIVSDDQSKDDTVSVARAVLQKYNVNYQILENSHMGASRTRNTGILHANHEWVTFLDADDYWLNDKLEKLTHIITNDTKINFIFHNEIYFNGIHEWSVNYVERYDSQIHPFIALVRNNFLSPTSVAIHKSLFEQAGMFDVSLLSAEDYDLWLKMSLVPTFSLCALNEYLAYTWVRPGSLSSNVAQMHECLLQVFQRYRSQIKSLSPKPIRELRRLKGRIYSGSGLSYWRQKKFLIALIYILYGNYLWLRTDWLRKIFK